MMTSINYIYLLQEREFLKTNENIYKIGKTKQENLKRLCNYPNGTQLIFQMICNDCDIIERRIIYTFTDKYLLQKDIGNEYFKGNYKDMIDDIYNIIKNEGDAPNITYLYNDIKGSLNETNGGRNNKYILLTITPNPRITLQMFFNVITKMMSKPWITNFLYVFEQRGKDEGECGKDFHLRAIIKKPLNKSYSHMLRELSSTANKVCDSSCPTCFTIKAISERECQLSLIHLTDVKPDDTEYQKHAIDIIWRQQNNLKNYYNLGMI
jgi:hypothetical protein